MGDVGKDPLPIIKESVRLTRKNEKMFKFFGLAQEKLIIIYKLKIQVVQ